MFGVKNIDALGIRIVTDTKSTRNDIISEFTERNIFENLIQANSIDQNLKFDSDLSATGTL